MAKGYPDFFGFSSFPWYGSTQLSYVSELNIANLATQELSNISGKGVLLNGNIRIRSAELKPDLIDLSLYIDNVMIFSKDLYWIFYRNFTSNLDAPIYVTFYSDYAKEYWFSVSTNMNYQDGVKLEVTNLSGGLIDAFSWIYYTRIL